MFKNYLKIAWRNIIKNKGIFGINIIGLALGVASCLVIMLFVVDELSYDRFNKNADNIARVVFRANINGEEIKEGVVMAPVGATLKQDFPEVIDATRIRRTGTPKINFDTESFRNEKFAFVDPNFFQIFTLPMLSGNVDNPLDKPNTVVLTEETAIKYFGNDNPIDKILHVEGQEAPFVVTAVIKNIPKNSHFHFDLFASMKGLPSSNSASWTQGDFFTYLLLKKGTDIKTLESKLPVIIEKYMGPQMLNDVGVSFKEFTKENQLKFLIQPLTQIHLFSDNAAHAELEASGNIEYVYIFSAIALFMLLIACINFMNLSTASATKRAKEVGVRKVLGSNRKLLIYQFLAESFLATCIALIIAVALLILALPFFNELADKELSVNYLLKPSIFALFLLLSIAISFLAGGYPAFFISAFKPVTALKNKLTNTNGGKGMRSGLVVFQFVISSGLILATLVVNQQMSYIQNKDLGYEKDQLLVLRESYFLENDISAFKEKISQDARVNSITQSAFVPAGPTDNFVSSIYKNNTYSRRMLFYNIDDQYLSTLGMKLVAGRNFSKEFKNDSSNVIINQKAAEILGFGENALGKTITRDQNEYAQNLTVVGVVKDFHFKSLHQEIEPLIMMNRSYGGLILKANVEDMSGLIKDVSRLWDSFNPKEPFSYTLLDESFNQTYIHEQKMGTVLRIFALLTILVACLGLFGLVTFTAEQRFKEIGIRKVLGSSVPQIISMLSKDFLKLVAISFLVAFPVGYFLMENWLQGFAYRIEMKGWLFVVAGLMTLLIACVTIGLKSFLAATMNPIKALKNE